MPSKETGEDLVAGHGNLANDTTWIIACRRSGEEDDEDAQYWNDTSCKSILVVTPSSVVGDRPEQRLDWWRKAAKKSRGWGFASYGSLWS